MKIGMLWRDDHKTRPLDEKVRRAAAYYRDKYGREPQLCYVNPRTLAVDEQTIDTIHVLTDNAVLPDHFWLGMAV